jgi:RimJ/RimL family protein N-acetyltransferase
MYNPYAIGRSIYLRAPSKPDLDGSWHTWFSDPETTQYLADRYWPNTDNLQKEYFDSVQHDKTRLVLSVIDKETEVHLGVCSIGPISWVHRYADIALVIGEKQFRNGQVAIEIISLLLEIAFFRLNLRNVKGSYVGSNSATEMLMRMFGFEISGRNIGLLNFRGKYVDFVSVQLSRDKWLERNSDKVGTRIDIEPEC